MSPRRLPVVSGAQLVRALEKDGFEIVSTKGSHRKLRRGSATVIVRFTTRSPRARWPRFSAPQR